MIVYLIAAACTWMVLVFFIHYQAAAEGDKWAGKQTEFSFLSLIIAAFWPLFTIYLLAAWLGVGATRIGKRRN